MNNILIIITAFVIIISSIVIYILIKDDDNDTNTGNTEAPSVVPRITRHTTPHPTRHTTPHPTRHTTPHPTRHTTPYPTRHTTPYPTRHTTPYPTRHTTPHPKQNEFQTIISTLNKCFCDQGEEISLYTGELKKDCINSLYSKLEYNNLTNISSYKNFIGKDYYQKEVSKLFKNKICSSGFKQPPVSYAPAELQGLDDLNLHHRFIYPSFFKKYENINEIPTPHPERMGPPEPFRSFGSNDSSLFKIELPSVSIQYLKEEGIDTLKTLILIGHEYNTFIIFILNDSSELYFFYHDHDAVITNNEFDVSKYQNDNMLTDQYPPEHESIQVINKNITDYYLYMYKPDY